MRWITLVLVAATAGCGTVPKEYSWDKVDCTYQRGTGGMERSQVRARCNLEGRVELGRPELPFR